MYIIRGVGAEVKLEVKLEKGMILKNFFRSGGEVGYFLENFFSSEVGVKSKK